MNFKRAKNSQGLTLVELLVTLAIASIIAMTAVPSYSTFIAKERLSTTTNELYNAYRFARNEALKSASSMILEADNNNWALGWKVKDSDGNILLQNKAPHASVTISATSLTVLGMGSLSSGVDYSVTSAAGINCIRILSSGQSELEEGACS